METSTFEAVKLCSFARKSGESANCKSMDGTSDCSDFGGRGERVE